MIKPSETTKRTVKVKRTKRGQFWRHWSQSRKLLMKSSESNSNLQVSKSETRENETVTKSIIDKGETECRLALVTKIKL